MKKTVIKIVMKIRTFLHVKNANVKTGTMNFKTITTATSEMSRSGKKKRNKTCYFFIYTTHLCAKLFIMIFLYLHLPRTLYS